MKITESYVQADVKETNTEVHTLPDYLKQHAGNNPNGVAFVFASVNKSWQRITWSELYQRSCAAAKGFVAHGLKPHEVVAINLRVCPEWLYATFGTMMAGAIPCGVSFTYVDGSDLIAIMDRLKMCSFLILDPGLNGVNWKIARHQLDAYGPDGTVNSSSMPYLRCLFGFGVGEDEGWSNVKPFEDVLKKDHPAVLPPISVHDKLGLFQTSGSTGIPKLIPYTHHMMATMTLVGVPEVFDVKEIYFNDRPFNWLGGYPCSVVTGQTRVTVSGFSSQPENKWSFLIEVLTKEMCSHMFALPNQLEELKQVQDSLPCDWPLKVVITGGQPLTTRVAEALGEVCKIIFCVYGISECYTLAMAKVTNRDEFVEYGCGQPLGIPGLEVKIVNEAGDTVPLKTSGEILARSPVMFEGYFNDEQNTKKAFTSDGWYRTDDVGRMNGDGELFVEGRKSNVIISGGFNVTPEIMEMAMKTFPGIKQVVIVPVPDEVLYQVLCACVLRESEVDLTEDQLKQYCDEYHADKRGLFTVLPKFYIFFEEFPLLNTGKTNRKEMERMAKQRFSSAS